MSGAAYFDWTPERLALAEREWLAGSSGQVIANKLGRPFTRNAVLGKAHRCGWKRRAGLVIVSVNGPLLASQTYRARRGREEIPPRPKPTIKAFVPHRAPSAPRVVAAPLPLVCIENARPFMSRASRECAWMLDDGRSCCARIVRGSYCAGHAAQVYRPVKTLDGEKMARNYA